LIAETDRVNFFSRCYVLRIMRRLLVLVVSCLIASNCLAQKYDIGLGIGAAGYMGEMNQRNPLAFSRGGGDITLRKNLNPDFSLKFAFSQLLVHGDGSKSSSASIRQQGLMFTSWITEASLQFEFNFFKFNPFDARSSYSPYIFAGFGGFHFNPYTFWQGHKVFLKGVGTEGQTLPAADRQYNYPAPYALNSLQVPVGFGFKSHLSGHFSLVLEYGYRLTFTDYLDDISGLYPVTSKNANLPFSKREFPPAYTPPYYNELSDRSSAGYHVGAQRGDSWRYDKYFYGRVGLIYTFRSLECPTFNQ